MLRLKVSGRSGISQWLPCDPFRSPLSDREPPAWGRRCGSLRPHRWGVGPVMETPALARKLELPPTLTMRARSATVATRASPQEDPNGKSERAVTAATTRLV